MTAGRRRRKEVTSKGTRESTSKTVPDRVQSGKRGRSDKSIQESDSSSAEDPGAPVVPTYQDLVSLGNLNNNNSHQLAI